METLVNDIRHAIRVLGKSPGLRHGVAGVGRRRSRPVLA